MSDSSQPLPETTVPAEAVGVDDVDVVEGPPVGWHRGVDDAINIAVHFGGAFACRNFALSGDGATADIIAIACCLFAIVFASFFSNVSRLSAQWVAFIVHAICICAALLLFAPNAVFDGMGAYAGILPPWMAAIFGSAMGSLAATGIGDACGD